MYSRNWHSVLIATVAISLSLAGQGHCWQQKNKQSDDEPKVLLLVPVVELPPYHLFNDSKQFTLMEWPKGRLREDVQETITSFDQIKGKTSRHYKLRPNEPMYKVDLMEEQEDHHTLRNSDVAHALTLPPERSPNAFLRKGDRIDIAATLPADTLGNPIRTAYILEDIEVLDTNSEKRKDAAGVETVSNRLLLRLTRPQALALKYYQDTARIDVDRRKLGDRQSVKEVFILSPDRSASSAPNTLEQKVLDSWLGSWHTTYQQLKAEWTPVEKTGTAEELAIRVIGGQFIQESSAHSDKTISRLTMTYDVGKKQYRAWWFSSTGQTEESTGKWDADQKTMTWSSIGNPDAVTTVKHHFKDDDTIEFDVITKDRSGKLLFHMEGKRSRVKLPTK